ncbi:carboxypeptidase-like regulatory domain-containing protein [Patulibacter defluvii]|uniref:carboxypeptidase-like regulatory domain-containing protein n=1 Tax=Patulibacter defluvii TaxID=3095358 RepID=UPI002A764327|nr:carboxypeptidase-like regulatory domain-containing protein [Patulibacter sp. DM4]
MLTVVLALTTAAVLAVPASAQDDGRVGTIAGTVRDPAGAAVTGVEVRIFRAGHLYQDPYPAPEDLVALQTTTTHGDGKFRFDDLAVDSSQGYWLHVRRAGYESAFHWMRWTNVHNNIAELRPDWDGPAFDHQVEIRPLDVLLRGRVADPTGRGLEGVAVDVAESNFWQPTDLRIATTTGADGRYALRLPRGIYVMRASRHDLVTAWSGAGGLPYRAPSRWDAFQEHGYLDLRAGGNTDADFQMATRPRRSCWGRGLPHDGHKTMSWMIGLEDQPEPRFPPRPEDRCDPPLAPDDVVPANEGPFLVGDQHMNMFEADFATSLPGALVTPMVRAGLTPEEKRAQADQQALAAMLGGWLQVGGPLLALVPTPAPPPTRPGSAPAPERPSLAAPATAPTIGGPRTATVRSGRLRLRTRCATATCSGTIRLVAARTTGPRARRGGAPVTVARGVLSSKATELWLRLTRTGATLLRRRPGLPVAVIWTSGRGGTGPLVLRTIRLRG